MDKIPVSKKKIQIRIGTNYMAAVLDSGKEMT